MLTIEQKKDWLQLIRSENVGPTSFRTLINYYGGARAALEALPKLAQSGGAKRPVILCPRKDIDNEWDAIQDSGYHLISRGDSPFPLTLKEIPDAPPLLTVRGGLAVFTKPMIAIVGSRNASAAGRGMAAKLARELAEAGYTVVSGFARGIDASAHEAVPHQTIAVSAGGMHRLYPPENEGLADKICHAGGALVSEMPLTWQARAQDFPRRNRIIAGLSLGVIVVEAALRSGSLITARMANEYGRVVFAVPGSPMDPRAEGPNALLRQGATLVRHAQDVLDELHHPSDTNLFNLAQPSLPLNLAEPDVAPVSHPAEPDDEVRHKVINALNTTPVSPDNLLRLVGISASVMHRILLELELAGRLERHPGGLVSLLHDGS